MANIARKIDGFMRRFFLNEKKSLLISGARQVGKTYSIRKVGKEMFDCFVEFNFINDPKLKEALRQPHTAKEILLLLSAFSKVKLIPGKTLVFFDEVQECPEIITAIKFLVDEGSYRYVMSGSLLGVELQDIRSIPVGYMEEKQMYPLDVEEFANAIGMSDDVMLYIRKCFDEFQRVDEIIHNKMLEMLHLYLIVGGMPEVVCKYISTNDVKQVQSVQKGIMSMYVKDIAKYDAANKLYIKDIFNAIPSELNNRNKRFILKNLNEHSKFDRLRNSFLWLSDAGVALPTYNVEEPSIPLKLGEQRNLFKLFMNDVGLLSSQYSSDCAVNILTNNTNINFGAIYENLVAQELAAHGYALYYFNSKKQGELDFVVEHDGMVLPLEVKSGKDYKRHNALSNVLSNTQYGIKRAIVFSNGNLDINGKTTYLPVYMVMFLSQTVNKDTIYKFSPM